jgi:prepilin-type N-terminal cleavage/methylation domain-containing protein
MTTPNHSAQRRGGFTLAEVLVSMTLLSVASVSLGNMLFQAARQANAAAVAAHQTAELAGEVSRLSALPFDQLAAGTTCSTITTLPATRCTTVNGVNPKTKQVTVVITPSGNPLLNPMSTTFTRTKEGNGNPLKSG